MQDSNICIPHLCQKPFEVKYWICAQIFMIKFAAVLGSQCPLQTKVQTTGNRKRSVVELKKRSLNHFLAALSF